MTLRTDAGPRTFPVVGIYYDYATERGTVLMTRNVYEQHWADRGRNSVAVYVAEGTTRRQVADALRARARGHGAPGDGEPHPAPQALKVFDRTFAVTKALRILAVIVAFIGVLSALVALQIERTRELGTLQALGLLPGQLWGLTLLETGFIGLSAGLLSLPTGLLLAIILIDVINVRSFGWTMQLRLDPGIFVLALAVSVLAALLAAIYPVRRLRRLPHRGGPAAGVMKRLAGSAAVASVSRLSRASLSPPVRPLEAGQTSSARLRLGPAPAAGLRARHRAARRSASPTITARTSTTRPSGGTTPATSQTADGRRFGFQLTFFRRGLTPGPPAARTGLRHQPDLLRPLRHHRRRRGPPPLRRALLPRRRRAGRRHRRRPSACGSRTGRPRPRTPTGRAVRLRARDGDLAARPGSSQAAKPLVAHGDRGLSPKSDAPGQRVLLHRLHARCGRPGRLGDAGRPAVA